MLLGRNKPGATKPGTRNQKQRSQKQRNREHEIKNNEAKSSETGNQENQEQEVRNREKEINNTKHTKGTGRFSVGREEEFIHRVTNYWTVRTKDFNKVRMNELHGEITDRWLEELHRWIPKDRPLDILDAGTGTGYFALLMGRDGHRVTGIDLTESMLETARENEKLFDVEINFCLMNVQETTFPSESFDVIVTRNVTWTLPDPEKAYREWHRLLRPGGILLNYDANYADNVRHNNQKESWVKPDGVYGHIGMTNEIMIENAKITLAVPAGSHHRPAWDEELASTVGFTSFGSDESLGKRVLRENDMSDAPMFLFWARK